MDKGRPQLITNMHFEVTQHLLVVDHWICAHRWFRLKVLPPRMGGSEKA
jgi:hypothetical protein